MLEVHLERDYGIALCFELHLDLSDLLLVQKQLSGAKRVVVENISLLIGADMCIPQVDLALLDTGEAVTQVRLARADGLHLRSGECDAALIRLVDEIVMMCLPCISPLRMLVNFHAIHSFK